MPVPITLHGLVADYSDAVTILAWHVEEGARVERGDVLLEVETAKATMEVVAPASGVVVTVSADVGAEWDIRTPVGLILEDDETPEGLVSEPARGEEESAPERDVRASPRARRVATELGVSLAEVPGSGSGRITEADVRRYAERGPRPPQPAEERGPAARPRGRLVPLSARRRAIGASLREGVARHVPVTLHADVDVGVGVSRLEELRAGLERSRSPSLADLITCAVAATLRAFPDLNATIADEGVWLYDVVNIGVAVHEPRGLVVAVIESADGLSLAATAERRRELQDRISASGVPPAAEGATFTITNLGHLGVRYFTPVLPPETSAILGVGKLEAVLPLSLTFDHQVVDGAPAAEFLQALGELIARPERWPEHWTVP